ncbi:MAG: Ig-like domain-containing protein, partial [Blastocatellia bacterium]
MKSNLRFESSNSRLMLLMALIALTLPFVIWSSVSGQARRRPVRPIQIGETTNGLKFRLSEGTEGADRRDALPTPQTSPLTDEAVNNLLKRLQPIKTDPDDEKGFAMRDRSLPPPKTGQTINSQFPPADSGEKPEPTATGALEVVRFAPEGQLALAPHLTVTFSQPMVAVTSIADLAASQIPVKLSPQPKGKWRWLGTKTLIFEPEGRFPMATNYSVEIPAGTKSATGGAMAAAKRWTFATPPVKIKSSYPNGGPHQRNPVLFIEFDQRIDPAKMLKAIQLSAAASIWKLRLASAEEIEADEIARRLMKAAEPNRWLAFRAEPLLNGTAEQPLTAGTSFTVSVQAGAPSAEGSRVTAEAQKFTFRTYDALQLAEARCGWGDGCRPFTPFQFQFNNPLDAKAFQQSQIKLTPAIEGLKVSVYGNTIQISGATKGRTTYTVTIDAALRDVFGQTLGRSVMRSFAVGDAYPMLSANGSGFVVLDPNGPPRFSIYTINQPSVKVRIFAVTVEQWRAYQQFIQTRNQRQQSQTPPGELVKSQTVTINGQADEMTETAIDLSSAMKNGLGHAILTIEPTVKRRDWEQEIVLWVQATQIGLDAFVDQTELVGWATSLKDGKPIAGAQLELFSSAKEGAATTTADGLVRLALPASGSQKMLVARKGEDIAFLPESPYWWEGAQSSWNRHYIQDSLRWHVFDDRAMYRPGEEVHIKGWLRRIGGGKLDDVGLAAEA